MKTLFLIAFVLLRANPAYCQELTKAEIHRLADFGKLWYQLCLFHPAMASGKINPDSLYLKPINKLIDTPSASNFRLAVEQMLGELKDPATQIVDKNPKPDSIQLAARPFLQWLPDSVALFHFNQPFIEAAVKNRTNELFRQFLHTVRQAKAIILDLRNSRSVTDPRRIYYERAFFRQFIGDLAGHAITYPSERKRIHYGHRDDFGQTNTQFYPQGWLLTDSELIPATKQLTGKPTCLLINKNSSHLASAIITLQKGDLAQVLADDDLGLFDRPTTYTQFLADSLPVTIRTAEPVYQDGTKTFVPDKTVHRNGVSKNEELLKSATALVGQKNGAAKSSLPKEQSISPYLPVNGYDSITYPSPALRLLGLARYWTIVTYFYPYKKQLDKDWDSVLYDFIPTLLGVRDSVGYTIAMAQLIKKINDSHGFIRSPVVATLRAAHPELQIRFIQRKTIIYKLYNDSLKNHLSPGDEIQRIGGVDVARLRDSLARLISASNDVSLQRNVSELLLSGPKATSVTIDYLHQGKIHTITLPRKKRAYSLFSSENNVLMKQLAPGLAYLDMAKLEWSQVDSVFSVCQGLPNLILDLRNYPLNTIWSIVNHLTNRPVTTALSAKLIVDVPDPSLLKKQEQPVLIAVTPKPTLFTGRLIILVNEITQSQAEYTCMVLKAASHRVTIIGSQTAGADGDITYIKIPGGITTGFSGTGYAYPDGKPTQGLGIVPDILIQPTIVGIKQGKDEVLERAINYARTGK